MIPQRLRLRNDVRWFAQYMEARLRDNDHKGGWRDCPIESLLPRIYDEYREVLDAVASQPDDVQAIIDECADIANFAMMVADVVHRYGVQASERIVVTTDTTASSAHGLDELRGR